MRARLLECGRALVFSRFQVNCQLNKIEAGIRFRKEDELG